VGPPARRVPEARRAVFETAALESKKLESGRAYLGPEDFGSGRAKASIAGLSSSVSASTGGFQSFPMRIGDQVRESSGSPGTPVVVASPWDIPARNPSPNVIFTSENGLRSREPIKRPGSSELLESRIRPSERLVTGHGSGILAIAAALGAAGSGLGYLSRCPGQSQENVKANSGGRVEIRLGSVEFGSGTKRRPDSGESRPPHDPFDSSALKIHIDPHRTHSLGNSRRRRILWKEPSSKPVSGSRVPARGSGSGMAPSRTS